MRKIIINHKKVQVFKVYWLILLFIANTTFATQDTNTNFNLNVPETISTDSTFKDDKNLDISEFTSYAEDTRAPQDPSLNIDKNSKEIRGDKVAAAKQAAATPVTSSEKVETGEKPEVTEKTLNQTLDKKLAKSTNDDTKSKVKKHVKKSKAPPPKKPILTNSSYKEIFVANNEQIKIILSNRDLNRIVVKGDKIQTINGPTGLYVAKNDPVGAAYLSISVNTPFTVFVATARGQSFSLLITPQATAGKAIIFVTTTLPSVEEDNYQKSLIILIRNMINHEIPEDYGQHVSKKFKKSDFYGIASVQPVEVYRGETLVGIIATVKSRTHKSIELKPDYFYQPGIKAIALSETVLAPRGTVLLYQVISQATGETNA